MIYTKSYVQCFFITVLRDVTFGDMHIVWYSPTEVYSFKQTNFINTKIMRSVTKKLGTYFQKCKFIVSGFTKTPSVK